jgi:hypothetical protein
VIHNAGILSGRAVLPGQCRRPVSAHRAHSSPAAAGVPEQWHASRRTSRCGRRGLERTTRHRLVLG